MKRHVNKIAIMITAMMVLIAVISADAADITFSSIRGSTQTLADQGDSTHARVVTGRTQYSSFYNDTAIAASQNYVLVDLSDSTNYPHTGTTDVVITSVNLGLLIGGAAGWSGAIGTVTAIDGSSATVRYLTLTAPSTIGLSTTVQLSYPGGGIIDDNIMGADISVAAMTTGTDLESPGGTVNAAVGDVVVLITELSGSTTCSWNAGITYWTK